MKNVKHKVDIVKIIEMHGDFAGETVEIFCIDDIKKAFLVADNLNCYLNIYRQSYDVVIENTSNITAIAYERLKNKDYTDHEKRGYLDKPEKKFKYTANL